MKTKLIIFGVLLFFGMAFANAPPKPSNEARSTEFETRCGWFSNPTPANAWLQDRCGEWIIGVQGGHQAQGDWPTFKARQLKVIAAPGQLLCECQEVQSLVE